MDMSNHARLYDERPTAANAAQAGLIQWIMRPFESLHRRSWSAPWDADAPCDQHRR